MKWFGQNFGPVCDDGLQVPIPVGIPCDYCQEPILAIDSGVVIPGSHHEVTEHHECFVRQIAGSVGHQFKRCHCYGWDDHSEDGLTRRQAARAALDWFQGGRFRSE